MAQDDSWKQLQLINEIVRYADAKAGLVLTLNGVLIGLIAVRVQTGDFFSDHPSPGAMLLIAMAFLTLSVAFDVGAVMPRLAATGQEASLLHFEYVGEHFAADQDDYVDQFAKLVQDSDQMQRALGAQVWANCVVARRKYAYVRWSLRFLAGALATTVLAAVAGALGG
jgi:hypothetical protein